jgi:hypothetical protein
VLKEPQDQQDHKVLKEPKEVKEPKAHLKEPKVI